MSVTITAADLRTAGLDDHFGTLDSAIRTYSEGGGPNVAIVSEPFGGREALVEYVTDQLGDVEHVTVPASATAADLPDLDAFDAIVVSDCHALFTRRIGGFDVLDQFLEAASASSAFVVTAWNQYAWKYLAAVRDVDEAFGTVVPDPDLSAAGVESLLRERYGPELPRFVETDDAGQVKSIGFDTSRVRVVGRRTVGVPVPRVNHEYLTSWGQRDLDVEAVVFRKIALLSNGNPGIATVLWERSVTDGEVAPAYVEELDRDPDLDDDEAMLCWAILANDDRRRAELTSLFDDIPVDRALQRLDQQGLVDVADGTVSIKPEALHACVNYLRRRRLVW